MIPKVAPIVISALLAKWVKCENQLRPRDWDQVPGRQRIPLALSAILRAVILICQVSFGGVSSTAASCGKDRTTGGSVNSIWNRLDITRNFNSKEWFNKSLSTDTTRTFMALPHWESNKMAEANHKLRIYVKLRKVRMNRSLSLSQLDSFHPHSW